MGYSTEFKGKFEFDKPVTNELKRYFNTFCKTRRMKRDNEKIKLLYPNWENECLNGDLGIQGEFFIGSTMDFGQNHEDSIIDYNFPPDTQPGLWCDLCITDDNKYLMWSGKEKTYNFIEWLQYTINNFFTEYILNGTVEYQGEDEEDNGTITITDNIIIVTGYREDYSI